MSPVRCHEPPYSHTRNKESRRRATPLALGSPGCPQKRGPQDRRAAPESAVGAALHLLASSAARLLHFAAVEYCSCRCALLLLSASGVCCLNDLLMLCGIPGVALLHLLLWALLLDDLPRAAASACWLCCWMTCSRVAASPCCVAEITCSRAAATAAGVAA